MSLCLNKTESRANKAVVTAPESPVFGQFCCVLLWAEGEGISCKFGSFNFWSAAPHCPDKASTLARVSSVYFCFLLIMINLDVNLQGL